MNIFKNYDFDYHKRKHNQDYEINQDNINNQVSQNKQSDEERKKFLAESEKVNDYRNHIGNEPMTVDQYLTASGYALYFPKHYDEKGFEIYKMYQELGKGFPLIKKAPNPLRMPTPSNKNLEEINEEGIRRWSNLLPKYYLNSDEDKMAQFKVIENAIRRHKLPNSKIFYPTNDNPITGKERKLVDNFQESLFDMIQTQYDRFPNNNNYKSPANIATNMTHYQALIPPGPLSYGHYPSAMGLGAEIDMDYLQKSINTFKPTILTVENMSDLKKMLYPADFFRELMITNAYLTAISSMNTMFLASRPEQDWLFTSEESPLLQSVKALAHELKNQDIKNFHNGLVGSATVGKMLELNAEIIEKSKDPNYTLTGKDIEKFQNILTTPSKTPTGVEVVMMDDLRANNLLNKKENERLL